MMQKLIFKKNRSDEGKGGKKFTAEIMDKNEEKAINLMNTLPLPDLRDDASMVACTRKQYVVDDLPAPDLLCLVSVIVGMVGLMARWKICSWLALFAIISSTQDTRKSELDMKLTCVCGTISTMGVAINHLPYFS
eukprot:TRINITY_DN7337_c0_g1_i1.p1 TRINITY_DN7337_c0_g1~~TRINITY_DN7337_c0_g1_i1.p1  ORF type:complete len:135 (+),score=13.47 TRINITY_DN7337_c0_g1_i1:6-410(+)